MFRLMALNHASINAFAVVYLYISKPELCSFSFSSIMFLPMVPGGGTVGQQMDFFSFFSFSSSTPPTWVKMGVKKNSMQMQMGVKKITLCNGWGVAGGGGGYRGGAYNKNGGKKIK